MKLLKLIALAAFALLFACCKATQPTAPSSAGTPSLLEVSQILNSTQSKFLAYSSMNNGNAHQAIIQTTSWVQAQPNVQSATALDSSSITIVLKSGLRTTFAFDEINSQGYSLFRGGGPGHNATHISGVLSENVITNQSVLIYCPEYTEMYSDSEMQHLLTILNSSQACLSVTVVKDSLCTYQVVGQFLSYGLVIIDAHGLPDGFETGMTITIDTTAVTDAAFNATIVSQLGQIGLNKLLSGNLALYRKVRGVITQPYWKTSGSSTVSLFLTTKFIDGMPATPNTVIVGNMCYSGSQTQLPGTGNTPIKTSFLNKNPLSYYCYGLNDGTTGAVSNAFAKQMEDSLAYGLTVALDTTHRANLRYDGTEFVDQHAPGEHFKHFGTDNYGYSPCVVPKDSCIVETLTDDRDGQQYPTVCIGNRLWMAKNLNYDAPGSLCYADATGDCSKFGRLYDWNTVMQGANPSSAIPSGVQGVCPKGWHVPSYAEIGLLAQYIGGFNVAGTALRSTDSSWHWINGNVYATDSSGFSALPAGQRLDASYNYQYSHIDTLAGFWTTTLGNSNGRYAAELDNYSPNLWMYSPDSTSAFSCRCIKDP